MTPSYPRSDKKGVIIMHSTLVQVLIDAVFECQQPFHKDELEAQIEKHNVKVKSIDTVIEILLSISAIEKDGENLYSLNISEILKQSLSFNNQPKS